MGLNVMRLVTVERADSSSDSFTTSSLGEREIKFVVHICFTALRSTVLVSRMNIFELAAEAAEIAGEILTCSNRASSSQFSSTREKNERPAWRKTKLKLNIEHSIKTVLYNKH